MRIRSKQIMAAALAAAITATGAGSGLFADADIWETSLPAYGAPASVETDETMYVNLDLYGKTTKVNVVKGCNLNGITNFTDYGTYTAVENMSTGDQPQLGDGQVTWNLPADQKGRFYYKCTLDNEQVALPWTFDVSYKLNGVPVNGEELAGASGLVEIHVTATPNENADLYYRNNMILMVAVPVDLSKCYSVDADGSQTQNMGQYTGVVFTALPGEDGDYTVRIGTDSFETTGVIMAMTPGTVSDLEHIKDLKKAKDTWKDAGDDLYDSLEQMAQSVEDMRNGVNQMQSGLAAADRAREKWSSSKDSILAGNDQSLAALTAMSDQLGTMVPHLQTAKETAEVVHSSMGDIVGTMGEMQEPLGKLYTRLRNIKSSTASIGEQLPDIRDDLGYLIQTNATFQVQTTEILEQMAGLMSELEGYDAEALEIDAADTGAVENQTTESAGNETSESETTGNETAGSDTSESETTGNEAAGSDTGESETTGNETAGSDTGESETTGNEAAGNDTSGSEATDNESAGTGNTGNSDSTDAASDSSEQTLSRAVPRAQIEKNEVPMVTESASSQNLQEMVQMLQKINQDSQKFTETASNLMDDISDSAQYSADLADNMDMLIEDVTALHDSLDVYYPDLQASLDDLSALVERTTEALNSSVSTLTIVQNTLKASSGDIDDAARESLQASMELLDKSLGILDGTSGVRRAGRTMKDVIDSELDRYDTENRFLFMDPEAEKVSFTSSENPSPKTLQVILRTDEISLDDEEHKTMDAETQEPKISPLRRMWNVLVKMWQAIADVFKNR